MRQINPVRWLLSLAVTVVTLAACTPSHTVQQTELYARKIGLTNQYEVSRWHNRRIPADSRLLVAISQPGDFDPARMISSVVVPLSSYFTAVDGVPAAQSAASARRTAVKGQYQFLFDVSLVEYAISEERPKPMEKADAKEDAMAPATDDKVASMTEQVEPKPIESKSIESKLSRVTLNIALIDVNSGKTIDKFHVVAKASLLNTAGADLDSLLAQPLSQLAKDLVGI